MSLFYLNWIASDCSWTKTQTPSFPQCMRLPASLTSPSPPIPMARTTGLFSVTGTQPDVSHRGPLHSSVPPTARNTHLCSPHDSPTLQVPPYKSPCLTFSDRPSLASHARWPHQAVPSFTTRSAISGVSCLCLFMPLSGAPRTTQCLTPRTLNVTWIPPFLGSSVSREPSSCQLPCTE